MNASAPTPSQGDSNNNNNNNNNNSNSNTTNDNTNNNNNNSNHNSGNAPPGQRAMRLKVLYTFDAEGKQTYLARWHQFVYTQVYYLNPQTPIGVVDLKTCLNSIASASPEIVAILDKDYSVYSYDYSEEDVPLQGLGMLSWIMGSGATTATAGAAQNCPSGSRLITGRIVSAQTGLFRSEKETLEVKMKLVPVPAVRQSDYINSMNVYNTLSQTISSNPDIPIWSTYFQANPGLMQTTAAINTGARPTTSGGYREPGLQASISQPPFTPPGSSSQPQTLHQQPLQPQTQQPRSQQQQQQFHPQQQQPVHQHQHQQSITSQFPPPPTLLPPPLPPPPPQLPHSQQPATQQSFIQQAPQPVTLQNIEQSPVPKITGAHPIVEENVPPKKKPRKRNPRPPAVSGNGIKKKGGAPAPSTASTPAAAPSDACLPASQFPPSESTFASPELPMAMPVGQSFAQSPLADIPSTEAYLNSPPNDVPGSSPPVDDPQHVGEYPRQDYSPEPTSPVLPETTHDGQEVADELDLNKELGIVFRQQETKAQTQEKQKGQDQPQEESEEAANEQRYKELPDHHQGKEGLDINTLTHTISSTSHPLGDNLCVTQHQEDTGRPQEHKPTVKLQFPNAADDSCVPAAPSPTNEFSLGVTLVQDGPAKKKRKYVRKKALASEVGLSEPGDDEAMMFKGTQPVETDNQEGESIKKQKKYKSHSTRPNGDKKPGDDSDKPTRPQGPTSAKERIEAQLREAVKEGKMPNYCENCGAIETPTWRRVSIKDESGDPEKDQNILLCNPCGLWHATKKSMRPPELWDPKKDDGPPKRPRNSRKRKATSVPQSENPQECLTEPVGSIIPASEPIIIEDVDDMSVVQGLKRAMTPCVKRTKPDGDWNDAVKRSHRRFQSSPVKREGTSESPIELDHSPCPTRRALFPRTPAKATVDSGDKSSEMRVIDLPPAGKENLTVANSDKTPKRRLFSTPEKRTPTRVTAQQSPFRNTTPQKQAGSAVPQLSPTSDLLQRIFSEPNDSNRNLALPPVSSAEFDSWFDSESVFAGDDMPSSPPFFGLYEDVDENGPSSGGVWSELLPDETCEEYGELGGILGQIEPNILEGPMKAVSVGEVHVAGSEGVLVDFSAFFRDEEGDGKNRSRT